MAVSFVVNNLLEMFNLEDEKQLMHYMSYLFIFWGISVFISLLSVTAPYGRYLRPGWGFCVPVKIAWFVQELPSFAMPIALIYSTVCPKLKNIVNVAAVGLYLFHYFQRTFVFPMLIRGGKDTPLFPFILACIFCAMNGYLQAGYILKYAVFDTTPLSLARMAFGVVLFFSGFFINIHSDSILRSLRKGTEKGYKIPRGGMFDYISGANFFGEILEWFGFFVINWTLPTLAFSFFTLCNIGPRAYHHHRWYKNKFEDYPKNRKALIPFLL